MSSQTRRNLGFLVVLAVLALVSGLGLNLRSSSSATQLTAATAPHRAAVSGAKSIEAQAAAQARDDRFKNAHSEVSNSVGFAVSVPLRDIKADTTTPLHNGESSVD